MEAMLGGMLGGGGTGGSSPFHMGGACDSRDWDGFARTDRSASLPFSSPAPAGSSATPRRIRARRFVFPRAT